MITRSNHAIVIGAGPAGLMAAESLSAAGVSVDIFDTMPSPARKFLLAGKGGLNLTHSEPLTQFVARYGAQSPVFERLLAEFGPEHLRRWAHELGIETFIGSSGRVFPAEFKAAPLLRAWLRRLKAGGVRLHVRHRWLGWDGDNRLRFAAPEGEKSVEASTVVLALGGASWPKLGSDGSWVALLEAQGITVAPLAPANCGFDRKGGWSAHLRERFAGQVLKPVTMSVDGSCRRGEIVLTETGIEGGLVYGFSSALRQSIARDGAATLLMDLKPDWNMERLTAALKRPQGSRSLANHLERNAGIKGAAASLLREIVPAEDMARSDILAAAIKALPVELSAPRPLAEAISTAGGVRFDQLDSAMMLKARPGIFVAGEMLDWEAPTGGYLLTGCFATGRAAGLGAARWVRGPHAEEVAEGDRLEALLTPAANRFRPSP